MSQSSFNRAYYALKPYLPQRLRLRIRGYFARRRLARCGGQWPILESAGIAPLGWPGWPDGKRFAFVLTHDVEGARGVARAWQLAQLESRLGFRSSFNFVPEGDHLVPPDLRQRLVAEGFEIGVHDWKHDGKLFRSREDFRAAAPRINHYLESWGASGFRAGFMFHNLDWTHDLNVLYDASTFDTDPFEPQPDGVGTIFPFWVPNKDGGGYVELPYTLPQDFTAQVLFRGDLRNLWSEKLDWIAQKGGMALMIVHPDYVDFAGTAWGFDEFPASVYEDFLSHVARKYRGQYWHALPRDVARHCRLATIRVTGGGGEGESPQSIRNALC